MLPHTGQSGVKCFMKFDIFCFRKAKTNSSNPKKEAYSEEYKAISWGDGREGKRKGPIYTYG